MEMKEPYHMSDTFDIEKQYLDTEELYALYRPKKSWWERIIQSLRRFIG